MSHENKPVSARESAVFADDLTRGFGGDAGSYDASLLVCLLAIDGLSTLETAVMPMPLEKYQAAYLCLLNQNGNDWFNFYAIKLMVCDQCRGMYDRQTWARLTSLKLQLTVMAKT